MATFTQQLKNLIKSNADNGVTDIGLDTYPIFEESYRDGLNKKIIDHYYNQEIGQETDSLFIFALRRKMNEIMPYYNQLYLSEKLKIDPLNTMSIKAVSDALNNSVADSNATGSNTSNATTTGKSRAVNSETPQVRLSGDADYASSMADSVSESDADNVASDERTGHDESEDSNHTESTTEGFQGSQAELLMRYRETFLNVDMMIIMDLQELFMGIWYVDDSNFNNNYLGGFWYGY